MAGAVVLRRVTAVLGGAGVVCGLAALFAFRSAAPHDLVIVLASVAPLLLVATVVGTIAVALTRQWVLLGLSAVVLALGGWAYGPLWVDGAAGEVAPQPDGPEITVMQSNIMVGSADPEALVASVREREIDVLTIQELTEPAVARLRAAGLEDALPHTHLVPTDGGSGAGVYSRLPLSNAGTVDGMLLTNLIVEVDAGLAEPVTVFDVHPVPPYIAPPADWTGDFERLQATMDSVAGRANVIVSGDFNATYSHRQFRDLRRSGYVDAADQVGAGILPTYPTDKLYPAVVGIDHILTKGAQAVTLERIDVAGSDHYGLIARVRLAADQNGGGSAPE